MILASSVDLGKSNTLEVWLTTSLASFAGPPKTAPALMYLNAASSSVFCRWGMPRSISS
jgi:hypothetical protein